MPLPGKDIMVCVVLLDCNETCGWTCTLQSDRGKVRQKVITAVLPTYLRNGIELQAVISGDMFGILTVLLDLPPTFALPEPLAKVPIAHISRYNR